MLRIIESTSAEQAKSYFSKSDYYTEGQELDGTWHGKGAERLGLSGAVAPEQWERLCDNQHPDTADKLTLRTKDYRRVGYDFNFHVPKSVSLLYGLTDDERLLTAFRESVNETMSDMESEMQTRVRKAGRNEDRTTGNMVWGEYVHLTSRPVDGVPDPHLHAHCFVFNSTFDVKENAWKAGQFANVKRDGPYFEAKFHSRLARKLGDLGIEIERTRTGWEIAGISSDVTRRFSRRTREIEEEAERRGITDPAKKAELGAKTREKKQKNLSMPALREEWNSRLSAEEQDAIGQVAQRIGGEAIAENKEAARAAVALAADHCFERQSVVPERTLLAESIKRAVGQSSADSVEREYLLEGFLVGVRNGRRMATTSDVLAEEQRMLAFARQGRGSCRSMGDGAHEFKRDWLNKGQRDAVNHVLGSKDRVILVRGAAGVGKTSMMQEAVEAIQTDGKQVFTFAPSARASRGVLKEKGFENADTVARLLIDTELQQKLRGQVVWIDEAGLVGTRTMSRVFDLAEHLDARIVLSGDRRQHGSVERGAALRLLEDEAGLVPAEVKEIQRQKGQYKKAIAALSEDRTFDGFRELDALGWICESPGAERYRQLASDYVDAIHRGETAFAISPTHLEGERCTNAIRDSLKSNGRLGIEDRRFATLHKSDLTEGERADVVNYLAGDVLVFHQNAKGHRKGERLTVGPNTPPVDQAARFQVFHAGSLDIAVGDVLKITQNGKAIEGSRVHNGDLVHVVGFDKAGNILTREKKTISRDWGFLDYGYCTTSHSSQGTDVDRVFISQSADSFPASSREQFYVSVSRGRRQATIYTDSKAELLDAVSRSDERLSATELMTHRLIERGAVHHRNVPNARDSMPDHRAQRNQAKEREDAVHEQ